MNDRQKWEAHKRTKANKGSQVARDISDLVNGYDPEGQKAFIETMTGGIHRTLQQNSMRLFIETMKAWAESEHYDARNEHTVMLCREIIKFIQDKDGLPFV